MQESGDTPQTEEITALEHQPELFRQFEDLLQPPRGMRRHKHTGERMEVELQERVKAQLALGMSIRKMADLYKVSPKSIVALRDKWVASGELAAVKQTIIRLLDRIGVEQLEQYYEGLLAGKVACREIPVHFGIFSDKRSVLAGDPSAVLEVRHTHQVTPEQAERWLKSLIDSKSLDSPPVIDVSTASPTSEASQEAALADGGGGGRDSAGHRDI